MRKRIAMVACACGVAAAVAVMGRSDDRSLLGELDGWTLTYAAPDGHLTLANADGSGIHRIDRLPGEKHQPNWSPDGARVAFRWLVHDEDHTPLGIVDADGSHFVNLTERSRLQGWSPSWSPDGKHLVTAATPKEGEAPGLYVMDADGSHARRITPRGREAQYAAWSPRGDRIAFTYVGDGGFDLFTIRPDGSGLRRLTRDGGAGQNNWPMWSPDGTRIAWGKGEGICIMNADGSSPRPVTTEGGVPGAWAPGPFITFNCPLRGGGIGICAIRPDGGEPTVLLGGRVAGFPGWRPKPH